MSFHVASFCLRFQIGSAYCEMPPQASWEHPITDQYAQSHMYYSQQAPNANQSWQMPQGSLPPDAPYYGFYLPGYPPFPPHGSSEFMYPVHGSHGHNSMDHNQYLSYHESAVPLGSRGRHNRRKMNKKRWKETKNLRTMALPEDSHESRSLLSIKGKVFVFSSVQTMRVLQSSRPTFARYRSVQDVLSNFPRNRMVLGSSSSASLLLIQTKCNWCLRKSCLQLKVSALDLIWRNINFV